MKHEDKETSASMYNIYICIYIYAKFHVTCYIMDYGLWILYCTIASQFKNFALSLGYYVKIYLFDLIRYLIKDNQCLSCPSLVRNPQYPPKSLMVES